VGFLFAFSFTVEQFGVLDFSARTSGAWFLGFGKLPCFQFASLALVHIALLAQAVRAPPPESGGIPRRERLLRAYACAVFLFLGASVATAAARAPARIGAVREWWPFVIEPAFFAIVAGATGAFWIGFNPQGWQALENKSGPGDAESAGEGESLVGGGIIPSRGRVKSEFVVASDDDEAVS
jgi:hypothetical protein